MSSHLHHPSLSMGGKKRGKPKFRNAEEAKKARELDASWKAMQTKWGVEAEDRKRTRAMSAPKLDYKLGTPVGRETQRIDSRDTGHKGAVSSKEIPQYTGTEMLGVAVLHKSNAVPVFRKQDAEDISKMRR